MGPQSPSSKPRVSIIVLNYNGAKWIRPCLESIFAQTIRSEIELIVADNLSTDGSDQTAAQMLANQDGARFIQHGANLGFCEGNNRAAAGARGKFLFFMNNDAWMEPDCMEVLLREVELQHASAATPYVMNWADNESQWVATGFDIFGLPSFRPPPKTTTDLFMPSGCAYLIDTELFHQLGEFDPDFFMYADELDLSWRVWISGHRAIIVGGSYLHHRGAAEVNPEGGERVTAFQTSVSKRYYANRNSLRTILKNTTLLLPLFLTLQVLLLLTEAFAALLLTRQWSFVRKSYFVAIAEAFGETARLQEKRRKIATFRKRGDLQMLRFLRLHLNRWDEVIRAFRMGLPKVTNR